MTNKTVLMIIIATAVSLAGILVFSPIHGAIAAITDNPQSQCPDGSQIQHWDKIIFVVTRDSSRVLGHDSVGRQFDLIVPSQPGVVYDLKDVVLTAIENQINPTHDPNVRHKAINLDIVDVKYDVASCGTTTIQGPQGLTGATGPQGPPGTSPISVNCPAGQFVTGFDANGALICGSQSGPSPAESACAGKASGDVCSFTSADKTVSVTCQAQSNNLLVCTPP
jgi:hypothetical protein